MRPSYVQAIMGIIIVILTVYYFVSCSGTDSEKSDYKPVTYFDPNRDSQQDLNLAVKEASRSDRHVLLDVGGNWCVWCKKLDAFFDENTDVKEFMNQNYVVLKINYSKENKNEVFLAQFPKIDGYPFLFVLDKQGQLLHSQNSGDLESGDQHDRDKVYAFLREWAPTN
jgi:thioredoxin-related protein